MTLSDLLSIKNEKQFSETCKDYLTHIGSGTSRDVYRLNSKQVIKVAKHDKGYAQNASECDVFDIYGGLGLFADIIKRADSYLWVIQPMTMPVYSNDEEFKKIVDLVTHIEESKQYSTDNVFLNNLYNFLKETEWKFLKDFKKCDSYGRINNVIHIIDYGMNNDAFDEYFK
jgi:hypothetical protein